MQALTPVQNFVVWAVGITLIYVVVSLAWDRWKRRG